MTKRDIFSELMEGFDALKDERAGKRTLRTTTAKATLRTTAVEPKAPPQMTGARVKALRERFHVSQPVFASKLRTKPQTIKNWEQGTAKPNAQAAILLALLDRDPKIFDEIAAL